MRPVSQFAVIFAALLALSAWPAWKLLSKFNVRIEAYEQQKRVDFKRPLLEELQGTLHEAHRRVLGAVPRSATAVAAVLSGVTGEVLSGLRGATGGQLLLLSCFDSEGRNYIEAKRRPGAGSQESHWEVSRFDPPRPKPASLSRAVGNALRGFEGYSLVAYEIRPLEGFPSALPDETWCYGAWLWDREHRFGMTLEAPAAFIESPIAPMEERFQAGKRFLYFLCVASYLMVLAAFARVIQRKFLRQRSGVVRL